MGWFDEQIKERKQKDSEAFNDSLLYMAEAVLGKRPGDNGYDNDTLNKAAIDDILRYYHFKPIEIPDIIKDTEEQINYALRPHGMMKRNVELKRGWYRDACGPMLLYKKDSGAPVAVFPKGLSGYYYRDGDKRISITGKNENDFDKNAICFLKPFPQKSMGLSDLLSYIKGCLSAGDVVMLLLLTLFVTLSGMLIPYLIRFITGDVLLSGNTALLLGTALYLITAVFAAQLITTVRTLTLRRLTQKTSLSVEAAVMSRLINLPVSFFKGYSSGELASRQGAVSSLCDLILGAVLSTGLTSLISLLYIAQIADIAGALAVPSLMVLILTTVISVITALVQARIGRARMEAEAKTAGLSFALINGVQKLKLAGAEARAFARWAKTYSKGAKLTYNPPLFIKINAQISMAVTLFGTILIYFLAVRNNVTPSEYMAFSAAYGMVSGAFAAMAGVAMEVAQIRPIMEMASPILSAVPEMSDGKEILTKISGAIELNNVYFRYNENMPYVVNGLSLKIKSGEYVAIVGKTGCGKSTLVRLLLGFEKPERGAIYYDGKDLNNIDLQSLRRKIGAVTQDGGLFQGDIFSNITISAPLLTLDEAWEAAELSGIAEDIRELPMGMNTIISEGQGGISGGQKQRIMIARAVAPKPKILIFDEATSALDNKTQKQVSDALDSMGCTRIVIAHRLSTIKHCDRILVFDEGKVIEDGTYDELTQKGGFFTELVKRQRLDDTEYVGKTTVF